MLIHPDFLLPCPEAVELYHRYAEGQPILDYHCHLPPEAMAEDRRFRSITELWLGGDHYKWRVLRTHGVDERFCTGDASDWEKFEKWAEVVPHTLRNPMYHWTHLELARPFGITDRLLSPATARGIYDECNARLATPEFSALGLLRHFDVRVVCTTDDPADSLDAHLRLARDPRAAGIRILPTWRPDKGLAIEEPAAFNAWIDRLGAAAGMRIADFEGFREALARRHDFFHAAGCRISDHGLETVWAEEASEGEAAQAFARARAGGRVEGTEALKYRSFLLLEFGRMDAAKGWVQQFHLGAMRNNNSRLFAALGPDTGFDAIGDWPVAQPLSRLLDRLDREGRLARTILYNLNPRDTELLATLIGCFQDGSCPGKMQLGSGWWFLDQLDGMRRQIEALSQLGMLAHFVGMLTDSRSFLSFVRHDYFRRLLCAILGQDMAAGLIPRDFGLVGGMVTDLCWRNANRYFGFGLAGR